MNSVLFILLIFKIKAVVNNCKWYCWKIVQNSPFILFLFISLILKVGKCLWIKIRCKMLFPYWPCCKSNVVHIVESIAHLQFRQSCHHQLKKEIIHEGGRKHGNSVDSIKIMWEEKERSRSRLECLRGNMKIRNKTNTGTGTKTRTDQRDN